jgi:threonine dehydrogenase-like Zn-dependent dehydrogenase
VVVECTGNPEGLSLALDLLRPRGTLVLKSTYAGTPPADLSRIVVQEITLVGSRCGPFAPALRLLETRRIDVLPLVERIYPLGEGLAAVEHANRRGTLKILLDMKG